MVNRLGVWFDVTKEIESEKCDVRGYGAKTGEAGEVRGRSKRGTLGERACARFTCRVLSVFRSVKGRINVVCMYSMYHTIRYRLANHSCRHTVPVNTGTGTVWTIPSAQPLITRHCHVMIFRQGRAIMVRSKYQAFYFDICGSIQKLLCTCIGSY